MWSISASLPTGRDLIHSGLPADQRPTGSGPCRPAGQRPPHVARAQHRPAHAKYLRAEAPRPVVRLAPAGCRDAQPGGESPAPLCSRRRLCPDTCHPRGAESAPRRHLVASRRGGPRAPARHPGKHPEVSRLRRAPVLPSGGRAASPSVVVAASVSKRQEYP